MTQARLLTLRAAARALLALGLLAAGNAAARIAVGPGGACQFSTIQAAIDAAAASDSITIDATQPSYDEKLTISDKSLTLSSCPCAVATCINQQNAGTLVNATISGAGGANAPVLKIVTTNANNPVSVNLNRLTIQDGHSGGTDGGGVSFSGVGTLGLTHTTVTSNTADYGAGINFKANGGAATLTINHDTFVTGNTAAQSGGGLRIEGDHAVLNMNAPNTWVANNEATGGLGGGIEVINAASANIGSPGYLFSGVLYQNMAKYGGGAAASDADLKLYTTDPLHPVAVDSNTAYNAGGGIYADGVARVCLADFRLTNNIAQEGTALYEDTAGGFGPNGYMNVEIANQCQFAQTGGVRCDASVACNIVQGNVAEAVQNQNAATAGAAILLQSGSGLWASRIDMRYNRGGYALRVVGNTTSNAPFTEASVSDCLFAENLLDHELLLASDGRAHLELTNCTLVNDAIGASRVIAANDVLSVLDSIVDEGDLPALAFSGAGANLDTRYDVAGNVGGLDPSVTTNTQGRPAYVDADHGDYRLFYGYRDGQLVHSLGVDYAPAVDGDSDDIRGAPRDQAVSSQLFFGAHDLGAYEMQGVGDRIFIATFGDDILLAN